MVPSNKPPAVYGGDEHVVAAEVTARPRPQPDRQLVPGQRRGAVELGEAASLGVGVVAEAEVRAAARPGPARAPRPRQRGGVQQRPGRRGLGRPPAAVLAALGAGGHPRPGSVPPGGAPGAQGAGWCVVHSYSGTYEVVQTVPAGMSLW